MWGGWKSHKPHKIKKINKNTFTQKDALKIYKQFEGRKFSKTKNSRIFGLGENSICCVFERKNIRHLVYPFPVWEKRGKVNEQNNTTGIGSECRLGMAMYQNEAVFVKPVKHHRLNRDSQSLAFDGGTAREKEPGEGPPPLKGAPNNRRRRGDGGETPRRKRGRGGGGGQLRQHSRWLGSGVPGMGLHWIRREIAKCSRRCSL